MDWLMVLGLDEGLVECATLCSASLVILSLSVFLTPNAPLIHTFFTCSKWNIRGVFSTDAMGALESAIFGHSSTVEENCGC